MGGGIVRHSEGSFEQHHRTSTKMVVAVLCMSAASQSNAADKHEGFEVLRYRLPSTMVSAKLALTLEQCGPDLKISGDGSISADAGAAPGTFTLRSDQLESARVKRTLDVTLHDNGSIATINSVAEDRTASIIGNLIKFVTSLIVPAAAPSFNGGKGSPPAFDCTPEVKDALARVRWIDQRLSNWRKQPVPAQPKLAAELSGAIDKLANERAALRSTVLHADVVAPLDVDPIPAVTSGAWQATTAPALDAVEAWFTTTPPNLKMQADWLITLPNGTGVLNAAAGPAAQCAAGLATGYQAVCLVTPLTARIKANVSMSGTGIQLTGGPMEIASKGAIPMPQWGTLHYLPLSVGFGGNRQVSLSMDAFGRVSESKWSSEARGESATAALAGIVAQANSAVTANSQVAREKAEIDQLTTQQSLNKLRACRDVLKSGGFTCP